MTRLEGRVIAGRYRIEHVVNSGANTVVTEAIDTASDRPVTVKIVRPDRAVSSAFRRTFAEQIELARSLAHPNVAAVLDAGEVVFDDEPTVFWVVEYLGGGSLRDIFDRGRLLQPSQALVVGLEACRALDAAHSRGIVHTELTPSKLVFGTDGRLRIVDFAVARLLGEEAWADPATVATHVARYASPEQALAMVPDEKTDIYALSLCLIEAITGSVPFAGDSTVSTLAARVGRLMPVTADMGSLAAVLERGGRPDAEDRWSAAEFAAALVGAAESLPRPEPIPVLATSLFASTFAARAATAPAEPEPDDTSDIGDAPSTADVDTTPATVTDADDGELAAALADEARAEQAIVVEALAGLEPEPDLEIEPDVEAAPVGDPEPEIEPAADPAAASDDDLVIVAEAVEASEPAPERADRTAELPAAVAAAAAMATASPTVELSAVEPVPAAGLYDDEHTGRRERRVLVGVVAVVCVAALGIAAWFLLRTKSFEVPDLVGFDEAVAMNEISGNGWEVQREHERSDDVPDVGHVVRTMPSAGERLAEGETFVMYVSDGPLLRTLAELTGMPIAEARSTLTEQRLVLVEAPPEHSEDAPVDTVIRWSVVGDASLVAGNEVLPETSIEVVVSLGPAPRPAPNLIGMTPDEANAVLAELQLVYGPAEDVFSGDIEAGRIAAQDPPPDTLVERGGAVYAQVSKGPEMLPLPDLSGLSYPEAQQVLIDHGFVPGTLLGTTEGTFFRMTVGDQAVSAGDTFARGTTVDLVFL